MLFISGSLGAALITMAFSSDLATASVAAREMAEAATAVVDETPPGPPPALELRLPMQATNWDRQHAAAAALLRARAVARQTVDFEAGQAIAARLSDPTGARPIGRGNGGKGNEKGNGNAGSALDDGTAAENSSRSDEHGQQNAASAARARHAGWGHGVGDGKGQSTGNGNKPDAPPGRPLTPPGHSMNPPGQDK